MLKLITLSRLLVISLIMVIISAQLLFASPVYQEEPPCVGDPSCYEPPPVDPGNDSGGLSESVLPKPVWEGFTDGRLNPDLAEYYSVWCLDGFMRVLRGVPTTALVDDIPIVDVSNLADGETLTPDSGLSVTRNGDAITISGNNGNLSSTGSKSFLLAQCLERNGDVPPTTDRVVQQEVLNVVEANSQPESTPEVTAEASNTGSAPPPVLLNAIVVDPMLFITQLCQTACGIPLGTLVFIVPTISSMGRRRKKGKLL
jgi:hypothetical protein